MEKDRLAHMLGAGWSYERIAREVELAPTTVAYWAQKHGLRSMHVERHKARGGLSRVELASLVARGSSTRAIAAELGVSQATVRHWLRRYGLATERASRQPRGGSEPRHVVRRCRSHGDTRYVLEGRGYYRCARCRLEQVSKRRRKVKQILVAEAGGCCVICGYGRHPAALQFHHLDPATKAFNLSLRGETRAIDALRAEARKCVLLCANCHAEVEAGVARLPAQEKGRPQAA
jgi:transposase